MKATREEYEAIRDTCNDWDLCRYTDKLCPYFKSELCLSIPFHPCILLDEDIELLIVEGKVCSLKSN